MSEGSTTIRISRDTWQRLTDRKEPGVSHDDVIRGLLDESCGQEAEQVQN